MAAARFLYTDKHLVCAICLDVVTKPVTTPCGHNFCKACIQHYWDTRVIYQCPLCNARFPTRPQMQVNTALSELAIGHKKCAQVLENQSDHDILCDVCSTRKDMAVVSCLVCLTSFCKMHLEPHLRVAGLRGHTLSAPVSGLEDRLCKNHHRVNDFYCKTDQACICRDCMTTDHKNHHIVLLETEYESKCAEVQSALNARSPRLKFFSNEQLIRSLACFTDLCTTHDFYEHHLVVVDHHRLVPVLSSLLALLNEEFKLLDTNCVRRCAALQDQEVTLQRLKDCAVDVTLDPDTAHCDLIVSPDGKAVMLRATPQDVPDARKRFKHHAVLSKEGFHSGKFYFEVQVKGKTSWAVGVASASLNRKYPVSMSVRNECWVIVLDAGQYRAYGRATSGFKLLATEKPQVVGVFVDHDAGQVSFYNVDSNDLIYTFSVLTFNGTVLHPYLCTRSDRSPSDREPLTIISPKCLPN